MSIEVILFVVVGAVSVIAAMMMLLSQNAVHSALFLILNFVCVAFLYLMLDASFLAMVQIAVYAGAIMVLFLFVIMLLGAEKLGSGDARQFKWLSPLALTLAMAFLIAVSVALFAGEIDTREVPEPLPVVRVAHAAPGFDAAADVYLGDQLIAAGVDFRDATTFASVEPGDYAVAIGFAGDPPENAFPVGEVTLQRGQAVTVVAYGELESPLPSVAVVEEDLSTISRREGRFVFFNANPNIPLMDVVDAGSNFVIDPNEEVETLVSGLAYGVATEVLSFPTGALRGLVVESGNPDTPIVQLRDVEVERNTAELIILGAEPSTVEGALSNISLRFSVDTIADFGGPASVGQSLFTRYVLPFQMVAVLLLAAMVGAIVITQRVDVKPKPGRPTRRKVSRPLTSVIASQTGHTVYETPEQPKLTAPSPEAESSEQPEPAGD